VPHTFVDAGADIIGVFPTAELDYTPSGPNPLLEK